MKKFILIIALAMLSSILVAQAQTQAEPQAQTKVEPLDQTQVEPPVKTQDRNLKKINFPQAFIQADKEYPAGPYWVVLSSKDGQPLFTVHNDKQELLFEELAVVKTRNSGRTGSSFQVKKEFLKDKEYFRIKVITPGQWLMGYFLVKK